LQSRPKGKMFLHIHPFVEAYLKKGFPNKQMKWYLKYQRWMRIVSEPEYPINMYKFFDDNEDEIRLG
jgi:ribonuclease G